VSEASRELSEAIELLCAAQVDVLLGDINGPLDDNHPSVRIAAARECLRFALACIDDARIAHESRLAVEDDKGDRR
jgi:hypothetical protein